MKVKPARPRYRLDETPGSLAVRMPYNFRTIPAPMWLLQVPILFIGPLAGIGLAGALGSAWSLVVGIGFSVLLAGIMGLAYGSYLTLSEMIEIVPERQLAQRRFRYLGGHTSGTQLHFDHVRNLRVEPPPPGGDILKAYGDMFGKKGGVIALDYGQESYRFGQFTTEAEARLVVSEIERRFPSLTSELVV
ncbi:MAG: hypothetical protein U1E26_12700 [Coriobacteriia bacterium]|nr:hypothetical protein [Coriobacteriia bacterium]